MPSSNGFKDFDLISENLTSKSLQRQFKLLQTYLALWRPLSSIVCTGELKTKFPVTEETAVFMFEFIVLAAFSAAQQRNFLFVC